MRESKTVEGATIRYIWIGSTIQVDITGKKAVNYVHGKKLIESDYGIFKDGDDSIKLSTPFSRFTR